jgi:alkylated DNA repair dioxygenase AlkB
MSASASASVPQAPRIDSIPSADATADSVFIEIPNFLNADDIAHYESLLASTPDWKAGEFINGAATPRLQKWFQDDEHYFSKYWKNQDLERWKSAPADAWLIDLRARIQAEIDTLFETQINDVYKGCKRPIFNSTLVNYYRDGNDYIRYHKDDETVFGENPTIAMLTFGCPRDLKFKWTISSKDRTYSTFATVRHEKDKVFHVEPGTLFLMAGSVQKCYWHGVERDPSILDPRFSLTFREHIC